MHVDWTAVGWFFVFLWATAGLVVCMYAVFSTFPSWKQRPPRIRWTDDASYARYQASFDEDE